MPGIDAMPSPGDAAADGAECWGAFESRTVIRPCFIPFATSQTFIGYASANPAVTPSDITNLMMAGMAPVMTTLMMGRDMRAMWPGELLFWFVMSLGVTAGFALAYPMNVWLVAKGMKHGLMTVRVAKTPRPGAPSAATAAADAMAAMPGMSGGHGGHTA